MPKQKKKHEKTVKYRQNTKPKSPLDINQIELAFINRALSGDEIPPEIEISPVPRIQRIQKKNLESMCKKLKKETDRDLLEKELVLLLNGEKSLPIMAFSPNYRQKN